MFYWIYDYPSAIVAAFFAFAFVAATWLGIYLLRPTIRSWIHTDQRANDMVGFALSSFSVLYGLLLGLLAVASYQNYTTVTDIVDKEAANVAALYRDVSGYPQPIRRQLEHHLREYARVTIEEAWPQQRRGVVPKAGSHQAAALFATLMTFQPTQKSEEILHAETLRQFNNFVEIRRARLVNVSSGIPAALWWVVALGSLLNIGLIWMLDMEIHLHVLLGGALACFLGAVIFIIAAMDNPFRGAVSVGPEAFQLVYESFLKPE
ncbi:DUF4239 domain-containing protein [Methylocapsa aurea]|uniref:bestrophin-like domain n=1 Tax=Methylocapsa aurea TaxID=663610 RepID=UPI00056D4B9A|nr:DUF4239 domain-containing protein [Methylocapsa aurea]